jgi:hypothetical protein
MRSASAFHFFLLCGKKKKKKKKKMNFSRLRFCVRARDGAWCDRFAPIVCICKCAIELFCLSTRIVLAAIEQA